MGFETTIAVLTALWTKSSIHSFVQQLEQMWKAECRESHAKLHFLVLLFQPPVERIWMVRTTVIGDPEHAILLPADRVCHHRLDKHFEIRPRIAIDRLAKVLSYPDDQCRLIDTGPVAFVLVFDVIRGVRSRQ